MAGVPICGCLGDQQAATLGQHCRPGEAKNTYGRAPRAHRTSPPTHVPRLPALARRTQRFLPSSLFSPDLTRFPHPFAGPLPTGPGVSSSSTPAQSSSPPPTASSPSSPSSSARAPRSSTASRAPSPSPAPASPGSWRARGSPFSTRAPALSQAPHSLRVCSPRHPPSLPPPARPRQENIGLYSSPAEIERLAQSVPDTADVYLVPALGGLFAPHWRPDARVRAPTALATSPSLPLE